MLDNYKYHVVIITMGKFVIYLQPHPFESGVGFL